MNPKEDKIGKPAEKPKPVPTEYQVGMKNGKFVPVTGFVKEDADNLLFVGIDGRMSTMVKSELSAIIRDFHEGESFDDLKKTTKVQSFEMYLKAGGVLGFNGWKVKEEDKVFITDHDDVVEIYDDLIYSSYGPAKEPPKPVEKAPLKAVPKKKK